MELNLLATGIELLGASVAKMCIRDSNTSGCHALSTIFPAYDTEDKSYNTNRPEMCIRDSSAMREPPERICQLQSFRPW